MVAPKAKAARFERELAEILWGLGYAVIRGPSSGGGSRKRFQPDLVAMKHGRILVFEVKHAKPGSPIYLDAGQILGLQEFARRARGSAYIAVRIRGGEWRFLDASQLSTTRGGNLKVDKPESGLKLRQLEEKLFGVSKRLNHYLEA